MARNFNGAGHQLAYSGLPSLGSDLLSLAFRFRTTQATTNTHLSSKWSAASRNGFGMLLNNTAGKATMQIYNNLGVVYNVTGTTTVNDGNAHSMVMRMNSGGSTNDFWIDGALEGTGTASTNWPNGGFYLNFGESFDAFWGKYVGDIWDVGYWHDAYLTGDEVGAYAKGVSPQHIRPDKLELYAPLVRDHQDRCGSGIGSFTGTTVVDHPRVVGSMV